MKADEKERAEKKDRSDDSKRYNGERPAAQKHRDAAARWIKLYRHAQAAGGQICLNPDDEPEIQSWIGADDPTPLLWALESFARTGTFDAEIDLRPWEAGFIDREMAGAKYEAVVEAVMQKLHVGQRQAQRILSDSRKARSKK